PSRRLFHLCPGKTLLLRSSDKYRQGAPQVAHCKTRLQKSIVAIMSHAYNTYGRVLASGPDYTGDRTPFIRTKPRTHRLLLEGGISHGSVSVPFRIQRRRCPWRHNRK